MATTVYVVTEWYPYDGEVLIDVYSTYEEAVAAYPNAGTNERQGRGPFHEIYEKEVIDTSKRESEGPEPTEVGT